MCLGRCSDEHTGPSQIQCELSTGSARITLRFQMPAGALDACLACETHLQPQPLPLVVQLSAARAPPAKIETHHAVAVVSEEGMLMQGGVALAACGAGRGPAGWRLGASRRARYMYCY